jgi:hypothetical protein
MLEYAFMRKGDACPNKKGFKLGISKSAFEKIFLCLTVMILSKVLT